MHYIQPAVRVSGDLAMALEGLLGSSGGGGWEESVFDRLRTAMAQRLSYRGNGDGLSPEALVRTAVELAESKDARITVDAGAHMFSCMAFWPAKRQGAAHPSNQSPGLPCPPLGTGL